MPDLQEVLDEIRELRGQVDRIETKLDANEALLANYVKATGEDLDLVRGRLDRIERPLNGIHP